MICRKKRRKVINLISNHTNSVEEDALDDYTFNYRADCSKTKEVSLMKKTKKFLTLLLTLALLAAIAAPALAAAEN